MSSICFSRFPDSDFICSPIYITVTSSPSECAGLDSAKMGRRSRISKIRSQIMKKRWQRLRALSESSSVLSHNKVPANSCAIVVPAGARGPLLTRDSSRKRIAVIVPQPALTQRRFTSFTQADGAFKTLRADSANVSDTDFDNVSDSELDSEFEFIYHPSSTLTTELRQLHKTTKSKPKLQKDLNIRSTPKYTVSLDQTQPKQSK